MSPKLRALLRPSRGPLSSNIIGRAPCPFTIAGTLRVPLGAMARLATPVLSPLHTVACSICAPRKAPALTPVAEYRIPSLRTTPYSTAAEPAALTIEAYHQYADEYLERLVQELEELAESRPELDVEFSSGVLTVAHPPAGTYVLNKQPPNKQIWLSSPISGPKRYDFVVGPGAPEASGAWTYLRDGSRLTDLLREEFGVAMAAE